MREKIESGIAYILGEDQEAAAYIGSLFSLSYPEIDEVSPEFWKSKLQKSIQSILSALAKMGPTVICLEDLHWADPSFLELNTSYSFQFQRTGPFPLHLSTHHYPFFQPSDHIHGRLLSGNQNSRPFDLGIARYAGIPFEYGEYPG